MPGSTPRLTARSVFGPPRADGLCEYLAEHGDARYAFYGYGKVAARDALDLLLAERPTADNVVLPAYLPHGIVEPFREAGVEPRYYRCDRTLRPEIGDIERLLDAGSLAIMLTHYFGQPQSADDTAAVRGLCEEYDAFLIDDNAHAPLSRSDGRLLGTSGDVGITSLRKLLPIPNGAVLFLPNETLADERLPRSGIRERYTADDWHYCARSLGRSISDFPGVRHALSTVRWLQDHRPHTPGPDRKSVGATGTIEDPREIYEAAKVPMSRLSARVLDRVDPTRVIAARRANYRIWDRAIRDLDGIQPVFPSLPDGVCPQYYPVLVEDPDDRGPLDSVGAPWPSLPREVEDAPEFGTANHLATHLYTLPVHQRLDLKGLGRLDRYK